MPLLTIPMPYQKETSKIKLLKSNRIPSTNRKAEVLRKKCNNENPPRVRKVNTVYADCSQFRQIFINQYSTFFIIKQIVFKNAYYSF